MVRAFRQGDPHGPRPPGADHGRGDTGRPGDSSDRGQEWVDELLTRRRGAEPAAERKLYCFVCGETVTSADRRVSIRNAAEHTFTNPGGYTYTIGCFLDADGCEEAGELTEAFTWFAGYSWRYAFCGSCRVHLGWVYESASESPERFFGLILNRLVAGREGFPSTS